MCILTKKIKMSISKFIYELLLILKLVLIVPAQFLDMIAVNRNNIKPLQSFVVQNLENTLQDVNNMVTEMTGNPVVQRIFIINSSHQPQNTQNLRSNNIYTRILQGSNFGSPQLNIASLSNFPSIGTIDSRPLNPGYVDSIQFHHPAFVQDELYRGLQKTSNFISNPSINQSFKSRPPHTTTPINTFATEYATPALVVNKENNGNVNKINDNDQVYDIDIRHA